jgi:hypothetical protein
MSDDLVKRLRATCNCNIDNTPCLAEEECRVAQEAADRIEELEADRRKTYEALLKVTRIHDEVEAKLAKAVELALEECPFRWGTPKHDKWWHHRRTTLAALKGENDE